MSTMHNVFGYLGVLISLKLMGTGYLPAFQKKHAKQKKTISCPYGQLIYIILVSGSYKHSLYYVEVNLNLQQAYKVSKINQV